MRKDADRVASARAAGPARPPAAARTAASAAAGLALALDPLPSLLGGGRRRRAGAALPFGIPVDFILFALTLLGVAVFHHHTLPVALGGLAAITIYKLAFTGFKFGDGWPGLAGHLAARMGDSRQPVPAADGFCALVAAF